MVEFARQLGVSSTITDKMGRTPSDSLEWLSARDLRSMGATISNKYQPSNEADQSNGEGSPRPNARPTPRVETKSSTAITGVFGKALAIATQ
jgi:hypothetical protein